VKKEEEYIQEFSKLFQENFKLLVEKAVKNRKYCINQNDLVQEVIHHVDHYRRLTNKMSESHIMHSGLAKYLNDDQNKSSFILTEPSGAGKSSIMAFVVKEVFQMNFSVH
jgi:hypothetical protein